jgi:hypothetical protein
MLSKGERIFNWTFGIINTLMGVFIFLTYSLHLIVCLFLLQESLPKGMFSGIFSGFFCLLIGFWCLWENHKNMYLVDYLIMKFKRKP